MIQKLVSSCLFVGLAAATASAHFVFVVPQPGGATAKVILSEDLKPSPEVDAGLIGGAKLVLRDSGGAETPLTLTKDEWAFLTTLPGAGTRVVHGSVDLGVMERGGKAYHLVYYPKTIVGDSFDSKTGLGTAAPVEIVPTGKAGALRLKLLAHGQPQPNMEITVILPDGTQQKMKTEGSGETAVLSQTGRYGAWARYWEPVAGDRDGKHYDELRNYATLVADVNADAAPQPGSAKITAKQVGALPQAAVSFGAVASDGWLYVYGGHIAPTHSYSTASVSGKFSRWKLDSGTAWEQLPDGPPLQGMNLAAAAGKIYRVGGMEPKNPPGAKENIFSIADCARFEPNGTRWEALPSLPEPRSSHDVVAIGGKLYVVGGWTLKGSERTEWPTTLDILDLSASNPQWTKAPQPFKRRALIAVALDGKMYAIGGFDDKSKVQRSVDIFDPATGAWSKGPDIPGDEMNGFAPAACARGGSLYLSVGDGSVYRLADAKTAWEKVGTNTPRIAHRMVADGNSVLVIGGAANGRNLDLIEAVSLTH